MIHASAPRGVVHARKEALHTIAHFDPTFAHRVLPVVRELLDDEDQVVRSAAQSAYRRFVDSPETDAHVEYFRESLFRGERDQRWFAAHILGCFGDRGRPAIPDLVRLLREARTSYLRTPSASSLGWLGRDEEDALLTLTEALEDSSKTVRKTASDALARIRSTEEEI